MIKPIENVHAPLEAVVEVSATTTASQHLRLDDDILHACSPCQSTRVLLQEEDRPTKTTCDALSLLRGVCNGALGRVDVELLHQIMAVVLVQVQRAALINKLKIKFN